MVEILTNRRAGLEQDGAQTGSVRRVSCFTREATPREGKPVTSPVGPMANDITRRARSQAHQAIYGTGWRPDSAAPELFQMWLGQSLQLPARTGQADEEGRRPTRWEGPSEPPRRLGHRSPGHLASSSQGPPVHLSPRSGRAWSLQPSLRVTLQNSGTRGALKGYPGGFARSVFVHVRVWARGLSYVLHYQGEIHLLFLVCGAPSDRVCG